jgi:antirestriction protein ArdC
VYLLSFSQPPTMRIADWATAKAWNTAGHRIKADEWKKGTLIIFFSFRDVKDSDGVVIDSKCLFRTYGVYAGTQVEDWQAPTVETPVTGAEASQLVTDVYNALHVKHSINHMGECSYSPSNDFVSIPPIESFKTTEDYEGARLHELGHWTGVKGRCDRKLTTNHHTPEYAKEELTAEVFSSYMSAHLGIITAPKETSAAYMKNLAQYIKDDKWNLYQAIKAGTTALDWVIEQIQPAKVEVEPIE